MISHDGFLRYASKSHNFNTFVVVLIRTGPNEQRTISREDAGIYHAVIIGAVYEFDDTFDVHDWNMFLYPLRHCIETHAFLSVVVEDTHTDKAYYRRISHFDLANHITLDFPVTGSNDSSKIEQVLKVNLDKPWPRGLPPWKIVALPLQKGYFIAFSFSHMIGDGPSGTAFHRTFLQAWRNMPMGAPLLSNKIETPTMPFPPPFDTKQRLPISWSFLLSPLIALFLPKFLIKFLRMRTAAADINDGTWTGSNIPNVQNFKVAKSMLKLRETTVPVLEHVLRSARQHETTLTGVFLQVITRVLSQQVITQVPGQDPKVTNFVAQVAVNMRRSIGMSNDQGGMFVSGCYLVYHRRQPSEEFSDEDWAAARLSSRTLADSASRLQDQAIGLLRYLPSIKKWTLSKLGQRRDCSFEVSNIGAFNNESDDLTQITKIVFAQPGHVLSAPLAFNVISVKGGGLVYTVTWQSGALKLAGQDEEEFVERVCDLIEKDLAIIAHNHALLGV
jgi:hypothetical protein